MDELIATLIILLILLDSLIFSFARSLLNDFLISGAGKNKAKAINYKQGKRNEILLSYIRPYIKRYKKQFNFFYNLYLAELFTLIPQYLIIIVCWFTIDEKTRFLLYILCTIKEIIFIILRMQFDSCMVSKYRKR